MYENYQGQQPQQQPQYPQQPQYQQPPYQYAPKEPMLNKLFSKSGVSGLLKIVSLILFILAGCALLGGLIFSIIWASEMPSMEFGYFYSNFTDYVFHAGVYAGFASLLAYAKTQLDK